jgi:xanthine dehydrogenase accessory factor
MLDVLSDITKWSAKGEDIALATVINTWGSSPRGVGANMAMTAQGGLTGSVSGGCVEGAVMEAGAEVLRNSQSQLLHFGVADETAWEVGLSCGGSIEVFVHPLDQDKFTIIKDQLEMGKTVASVVVINGPAKLLGTELVLLEDGALRGSLGGDLDSEVLTLAQGALDDGSSRRVVIPTTAEKAEPIELFINVILPSPTLIVIGGVHIAIPLVSLAKTLGYYTIVVDPRKMFGTETRFPDVDQLILAWPDKAFEEIELTSSTAIAMLTQKQPCRAMCFILVPWAVG